MLVEGVQLLKEMKTIGASMVVVLSSGPDYCDLTPEEYQDKFKQMAALSNTMSSNP